MKKYFKNGRFIWVSPFVIACLGVFNLLTVENEKLSKSLWWILTPLAFIFMVYGIYLHIQYAKEKARDTNTLPSES
jgi:hypothetical protein